jgi:hypothetical protein
MNRNERGRFATGSSVGDHQASQTPGAGHGHPVMAQYDGSRSVGTHAPIAGPLTRRHSRPAIKGPSAFDGGAPSKRR